MTAPLKPHPDPGRELRCAFAALTDRDHHDVFPNGRAGKLAAPTTTTTEPDHHVFSDPEIPHPVRRP